MIKQSIMALLLAVSVTSLGFAETKITKVVVALGSGVNADYNALTKILTWSAGASGTLYDADYNIYTDGNINVSGTFSNALDTSSGGQAMANFSLDSVVLTFNSIVFDSLTGVQSTGVLTLSSYNSNKYWESELAPDADVLHGQALVGVNAAFVLEPIWGATHEVVWDGANNVSVLDAMISLPVGADFQSYLSSYFSSNNMIVVNADETTYTVPEPCTLGLLAIGGIGLLRKRPWAKHRP